MALLSIVSLVAVVFSLSGVADGALELPVADRVALLVPLLDEPLGDPADVPPPTPTLGDAPDDDPGDAPPVDLPPIGAPMPALPTFPAATAPAFAVDAPADTLFAMPIPPDGTDTPGVALDDPDPVGGTPDGLLLFDLSLPVDGLFSFCPSPGSLSSIGTAFDDWCCISLGLSPLDPPLDLPLDPPPLDELLPPDTPPGLT